MLSGLTKPSDSMFQNMTGDFTPDVEDMEKERERALFSKEVKLKSIHSKTYDLSNTRQNTAFTKAFVKLYAGMRAHTHVLLFSDRKFVEAGEGPRWIAHVEWAVFDLNIEPNEVIPSGDGRTDKKPGDTDG